MCVSWCHKSPTMKSFVDRYNMLPPPQFCPSVIFCFESSCFMKRDEKTLLTMIKSFFKMSTYRIKILETFRPFRVSHCLSLALKFKKCNVYWLKKTINLKIERIGEGSKGSSTIWAAIHLGNVQSLIFHRRLLLWTTIFNEKIPGMLQTNLKCFCTIFSHVPLFVFRNLSNEISQKTYRHL